MPGSFMDRVSEARSRIREIDAPAAAAAVERGGLTILDVREPAELAGGFIPGAVNVPMGDAETQVPRIAPDRETRILCYCAAGNRSALVADRLQQLGYGNVESMAGGFAAWARSGFKVDR